MYSAKLALVILVSLLLMCANLADATERGEDDEKRYVLDDDPEAVHMLVWSEPTLCLVTPNGEHVRVQCFEDAVGGPLCLVAPDEQQGPRPTLERVGFCRQGGVEEYQAFVNAGYRMVTDRVVAEAPPGWKRDVRGRVFQVTFDLRDRYYLGAGYAPVFDESGVDPERVRFEMGFSASWLDPEERTRHTLLALDGMVAITDIEAFGLLLAYDMSQASDVPLLRITTFFGEPERHDLYMDVGWGIRVLEAHMHPHRAVGQTEVTYGELHVAWDIWQSSDLYNHLRLRSGAAFGQMWHDSRENPMYLATVTAIEARFTLDEGGFHNLVGDVHYRGAYYVSGAEDGRFHHGTGARAAYELIFLAINDQPLSLTVEATTDYRTDLGPNAPSFDATLLAGLRFSFWAPARIEGPNVLPRNR